MRRQHACSAGMSSGPCRRSTGVVFFRASHCKRNHSLLREFHHFSTRTAPSMSHCQCHCHCSSTASSAANVSTPRSMVEVATMALWSVLFFFNKVAATPTLPVAARRRLGAAYVPRLVCVPVSRATKAHLPSWITMCDYLQSTSRSASPRACLTVCVY